MPKQTSTITDIFNAHNEMLFQQQEAYISSISKINISVRELLKNDLGNTFVQNCAKDIAGDIVRRYFDMGDYYITVDQMYNRIVHFSYESENDPLSSDIRIRKSFYNITDSRTMSQTLNDITRTAQAAQTKMFNDDRSHDNLDKTGKILYRKSQTNTDGRLYDELTGQEGNQRIVQKNGRDIPVSDLHADHIQSRAAAVYNSKYITTDGVEKLKQFYNSSDNMQVIHSSANTAKGDVRVCELNGEVVYLSPKDAQYKEAIDITHKATSEQLTDATIQQWEKGDLNSSKIKTLMEKGYLDENGKVKLSVKKELEHNIRQSQNAESVKILENVDYKKVADDAKKTTQQALWKIIAGQVLYYVLPPMVFETQKLVSKKGITIDMCIEHLKCAGKRIATYVTSKLKEIFGNIIHNSLQKFLKTFFDIIIEMVKSTIKKLMNMLKQLVMSLVNCIKIIADKTLSVAQRADAVTKTLTVTVNGIVLELLFEFMEKQFKLPNWLMEALQIVVTVLSTNLIMLVLQEADLFNVQYGLMVANIEHLFAEEKEFYLQLQQQITKEGDVQMELYIENVKCQLDDMRQSIRFLNTYETDVTPELKRLNQIFAMEIDFNDEWNSFLTA